MLFLLFGAALAAPLSPDQAVRSALSSHPELARAEAELSAARGARRASTLLHENPEIEAGYALVGERLEASVAQPLSLSGEGLAERRSQRAQVAAAEAALTRTRLEVAAEARSAYIDAVVAHQGAALTERAFDLATQQLQATAASLRAGEASDLDLRLARLEQAKVAAELMEARADEAEALATLSALVRVPVQGEDLLEDPLLAAPEPSAGAGAERSDVVAARQGVEAAEAALTRERAARVPQLTVGAFYEDDGAITAGPTLGWTLPLWQQNQAGVAEARGDLGVAQAELGAAIARSEAERRTATEDHSHALATVRALEASPEDSRAALAAVEAGVRSGELDLVTTLLLRDEIVAGQTALLASGGALAHARVRLLLATEDAALLGGGAP